MKRFFFFLLFFSTLLTVSGQDIFVNLNSSADEQLPILSPDRRTIYFTRTNFEGNTGGISDPGDIWYSVMDESGGWSTPKNARELNNIGFNAVLGFSVDNRLIYLHNHYNRDNSSASTQGISRAVSRGDGWSRPENISIPYFLNRSRQQSGYISPDGKVMVLSIQGYNTNGVEDLYVCFNEGSKWSEPVNLGKVINSSAQEFTPFLSSDKKTLYYSSNGKGGKGSSDVFMSTRLDESWKNWSDPVPVNAVNSQGRELGYREYDDFALFSSTINSDGYSDIKYYSSREDDKIEPVEVDTPLVVSEPVLTDKQAIFGTIKNANDKTPVPAASLNVQWENESTPVNVESGGVYSYNYLSPGTYRIQINAAGFISASETVEITEGTTGPVEKNILLQPVEVGTTVQLHNVLFAQSKPDILPESFPELDMVVDFLRANPSIKIRLEGHTDNRGVPKHNLRLSRARVESVEEYLVNKGISSRRISGKGYGGTKPIADNSNEETRKLNRRVEFTIVKD